MKAINIKKELENWLVDYLTDTVHNLEAKDSDEFNKWAKSFEREEAAFVVGMEFVNDEVIGFIGHFNDQKTLFFPQKIVRLGRDHEVKVLRRLRLGDQSVHDAQGDIGNRRPNQISGGNRIFCTVSDIFPLQSGPDECGELRENNGEVIYADVIHFLFLSLLTPNIISHF